MFEAKTEQLYYRVSEKGVEEVKGSVIGESRWNLYLNGAELVTFMATPRNLHFLALGFLASEKIVSDMEQVASIRVNLAPDSAYWYIPSLGVDETRKMSICEEGVGSIEVRLTGTTVNLPSRRVITSGCGGGTTFADLSAQQAPLDSDCTVRASEVFGLMRELLTHAELYKESRGVHTAALGDGEKLVAVAEDIGRHNTIDKIRGECMMRGITTRDRILISTGRISSEMITKTASMQIPIVASRTSPTSLAVQLARTWNIALIGYARGGQMQVYCGIERIRLG